MYHPHTHTYTGDADRMKTSFKKLVAVPIEDPIGENAGYVGGDSDLSDDDDDLVSGSDLNRRRYYEPGMCRAHTATHCNTHQSHTTLHRYTGKRVGASSSACDGVYHDRGTSHCSGLRERLLD